MPDEGEFVDFGGGEEVGDGVLRKQGDEGVEVVLVDGFEGGAGGGGVVGPDENHVGVAPELGEGGPGDGGGGGAGEGGEGPGGIVL